MSELIYHSLPIDFLYPGSLYSISGVLFTSSGDDSFQAQITNSAVDSVLFGFDFNGQLNKWHDFFAVFTATLQMSGGLFRIEYKGSGNCVCLFDEVKISDYRDMLSLGVIQIYPEWDMKRFTVQNREDHRTRGGKMFSYKWGDYERLEVPIEYISDSKAAIINSWWATDALIYFKIYSGGMWQTNTCYLMNDGAPFDIHPKPYDQYFNGRLELETF